MNVTSYGAAKEVTGSCHLIDTGTEKILFDCGMNQGSEEAEAKNHDAFPFDSASLDAVVLSHAHLDHTGRIPKLVKDGYRGPVYATHGTLELVHLIWKDSLNIMKYEQKKTGKELLFDEVDIDRALSQCEGQKYRTPFAVGKSTIVLKDAGHIFGSAFIELEHGGKRIAFSGDLGNDNVPILQDTEPLGSAIDLLLCESTYGDRIHKDERMRKDILREYVQRGYERGGTIMMPAFSLERTQEILYLLDEMIEEDKSLPRFPIFLDSPMAIDALPTYNKYTEYYDTEAGEKYKKGNVFFDFRGLTITRTVEESKKINDVRGVKMVIAGSGMMNGGRIIHHALRYLSDPTSTLILVGYQAKGTLGRKLEDGIKQVHIFRERIDVHCHIEKINALSAHADQEKLVRWIENGGSPPKKVCFVHGEPTVATGLAHKIKDTLRIPAYVPAYGERVDV
ncbi:MAG: MBL fold metallo-hydrolase [Candidatus Magasanikbacteria bacterium CG11_big_fil_rev_8_21_14_0_20_43_7]|uniref:MBL fold metallo-hydrolase n=1 Tax=Candidatus Magasanikbacteria bacterium CG11_big_fil_rev_8_21_14_0_20_43_7 TaxID=1974654 RepID=A0A2H0N2B7_9BACT|nr:MAG: MBL fold metallo-hydrolase [Candidatus Magasanikbacteria bacterium CG11_big_fil_rev_8_21_14_0_20_43_7]